MQSFAASCRMSNAAVCAGLAAFAALAVAAGYARKVVQKLADVETAVWYYADKVQAAEMRQDRSAGLQNDVSRKIMQAFEQCREKRGCSPEVFLQRRLQVAMESACRAAVLLGLADKQELFWKCSVLEAKLCLCRDWLLQLEDENLKNGCSIISKVIAGQLKMHPAAYPQTTFAEWKQLAETPAMQVFGMKPLLMQIEDRWHEVQALCAGSSKGSEQLRAAVQKVQHML